MAGAPAHFLEESRHLQLHVAVPSFLVPACCRAVPGEAIERRLPPAPLTELDPGSSSKGPSLLHRIPTAFAAIAARFAIMRWVAVAPLTQGQLSFARAGGPRGLSYVSAASAAIPGLSIKRGPYLTPSAHGRLAFGACNSLLVCWHC
mmetsp:Transcript_45520/g.105498  ORF Transcript_45520/g.105498 Transcript_45520/m.105498 type:complete len:147 (-) Transcript_45520:1522-1962(-)